MERYIRAYTLSRLACTLESHCNDILQNDAIYTQDLLDLDELEDRYLNLDLSQQQRRIINDYIACLESAKERKAELAYMAGTRDAAASLKAWHERPEEYVDFP